VANLSPTTLLHEAYVRLVDQRKSDYADRTHFLAIASIAIRRVLVDLVRRQHAGRRGGELQRTSLATHHLGHAQSVDLLDLHEALERLAADEPRAARVIELRFFGGLSMQEAATELGVSVPTVERDWRFARAWLLHALA
jgi:RNA polymerase sigma factor (TIGR02999 family)